MFGCLFLSHTARSGFRRVSLHLHSHLIDHITSVFPLYHLHFNSHTQTKMLPTTVLSLAVAFLASSAQAIKVTAPTKSTVQASGSALQLTWDSVNTDPTSFAIVLVNQVSCRESSKK